MNVERCDTSHFICFLTEPEVRIINFPIFRCVFLYILLFVIITNLIDIINFFFIIIYKMYIHVCVRLETITKKPSIQESIEKKTTNIYKKKQRQCSDYGIAFCEVTSRTSTLSSKCRVFRGITNQVRKTNTSLLMCYLHTHIN